MQTKEIKTGNETPGMVRDMDLIRDILRVIEQDPTFDNTQERTFPLEELGMDESRYDEVNYHVTLLVTSGFVNATRCGLDMPWVRGLTWEGHELIADISDPDVWAKTKERMKGLSGVGIAFAWEVAKSEIRKKLGL